ncbi:MAG: 2-oxo acid dehydrogenase subunit E2 [Actinomycetota bacterium]|nr:2-oxo acid dehydrogenase subunit E2 [Actinomycetota bacterium]
MAATREFVLPDLGEGLTEGEVVAWLVAPGDRVEVDQPVAEIETAKAVVEVPCPFSGTAAALHAEVGEEVRVGAPLLTVALDAAPGDDTAPPGGDAVGQPGEEQVSDMVPEPSTGGDGEADASGSVLVGYGTGHGATRDRPRAAPTAAGPAVGDVERPLAKPPVRKLAKDLGLALSAVHGTGPGGVITRDDVRAAAGDRAPGDRAAATEAEVEVVPLRGVRKAVADKMADAHREIPAATTWLDVDATELWEVSGRLTADEPDAAIGPLAVMLRACVAGLGRFGDLNARIDLERGEIHRLRQVHLGVAVQTDRGLMVPVLRDAHRRTLSDLAAELRRLVAAAREGTLTPDQLRGGTFTVSNYGSLGVDGGSPIVNHPEAAILGVGRAVPRPWVHEGTVQPRRVMQLSLTFDHRLCDGAEAAGFLRFVGDCAERPARLLAFV